MYAEAAGKFVKKAVNHTTELETLTGNKEARLVSLFSRPELLANRKHQHVLAERPFN